MSFVVRLAEDLFSVDPGSSAPLALELTNRTDSQDRFEIEVEGIDPTWVAIPVPSFLVEGRESHTERLFIKPPRESESVAGTYPFVVSVRSVESGETRSVQGALEVKPFANFNLDIQPKKGKVSPLSSSTQFQVTVMNLGNSEQTLQMFAADTEGFFAFEFDADQVLLSPGQQRTLTLGAASTKGALLANSRLQNFTVTARSTENPAMAAAGTGQIEQKALATPGAFLIFLVAVLLLSAWIFFWPKKPSIDVLDIRPQKATVGQPVEIHWRASRATSVRIQIGNWVQDRQLPEGSTTYTPDAAGDFAVEVMAVNGDQQVLDASRIINVAAPPEVPKPEVLELSVENKPINFGQPFMLHYKLSDAVTKAVLYPLQRDLDVKEQEIQLTADTVGKNRLTVKAYNAAGETAERSVNFTVVKASQAKVVRFVADPKEVPVGGGQVVLSFTVVGAARAEIVYKGQTIEIDPATEVTVVGDQWTGKKLLDVTSDTTFKLIVYDADNLAASGPSVSVTVKKSDSSGEPSPATTGGGR